MSMKSDTGVAPPVLKPPPERDASCPDGPLPRKEWLLSCFFDFCERNDVTTLWLLLPRRPFPPPTRPRLPRRSRLILRFFFFLLSLIASVSISSFVMLGKENRTPR